VNDDDKQNLEDSINNIENQIKIMEEKQKEVTDQLNVLDTELKKFT
jgi:chaperonin cofactor prefoldin